MGDVFVLLAAAVALGAAVRAWRCRTEAAGVRPLGELVDLGTFREDRAAPRRARAGLGR